MMPMTGQNNNCVRISKVGSDYRVTDGDDVDAASSRSHCLTPRQRRVVRVAVRHNQQVVGHARPVSVSRLEHHVRRETASQRHNDIAQYMHQCTVRFLVSKEMYKAQCAKSHDTMCHGRLTQTKTF